jgi:hypothetical protein
VEVGEEVEEETTVLREWVAAASAHLKAGEFLLE